MLRVLSLTAFLSTAVYAAVWPAQIGSNALKSEQKAPIAADQALWDEYGLVSATEADYGAFHATAYRFKDATDAFAAGQWLGATVAGNYAISCEGTCPAGTVLENLELPGRRRGDVPLVWAYMPSKGVVPHSGRYVLGPAGPGAVCAPDSSIGGRV